MWPDLLARSSGQASFASQVKLMREPGAGDRVIFTYLRIDPESKHVQLVYPTLQTLPPSLQPLPEPAGTPTLADVDRDYEHAIGMKVAMWDIGTAALWGKTSKMSIPRYRGAISPSMPVTPPLPPFQDARDPRYARLVAMTKQVDDAQGAEFEQQRQAHGKEVARAINSSSGTSYSAPQSQQGVQRWCTQSGGGVVGRVPC